MVDNINRQERGTKMETVAANVAQLIGWNRSMAVALERAENGCHAEDAYFIEKLRRSAGVLGFLLSPPAKEAPTQCTQIAPPPKEDVGTEPLFRVVYVIDVNATNVQEAAKQTHETMTDPASLAPVLQVMDCEGKVVTIDLSEA